MEDVTCEDKRFFMYRGKLYPDYIRNWRAGRFVFEFAKEFCQGNGLDIGGDSSRDCVFPGAIPVNIADDSDTSHAMFLPRTYIWDYIFSSMTLEHLKDPVAALRYWAECLKPGGTLFLYLPHPDMEYWRPENMNGKDPHQHIWYPAEAAKMVADAGFKNVIHGERDLYWGYCVVGVKPK